MSVPVERLNYLWILLFQGQIGEGIFPKNWPFYQVIGIETDASLLQ